MSEREVSKTTLEQVHKQIEKIECFYKYSYFPKYCSKCDKRFKCELYRKERLSNENKD